jgi:hypothetical protein
VEAADYVCGEGELLWGGGEMNNLAWTTECCDKEYLVEFVNDKYMVYEFEDDRWNYLYSYPKQRVVINE